MENLGSDTAVIMEVLRLKAADTVLL
jgi:hypothetical protein